MTDTDHESLLADDWKSHAARIIRLVDPHYHGPLYLCDMRAAGIPTDNAMGATSILLDLQLRESLLRQDRWTLGRDSR